MYLFVTSTLITTLTIFHCLTPIFHAMYQLLLLKQYKGCEQGGFIEIGEAIFKIAQAKGVGLLFYKLMLNDW